MTDHNNQLIIERQINQDINVNIIVNNEDNQYIVTYTNNFYSNSFRWLFIKFNDAHDRYSKIINNQNVIIDLTQENFIEWIRNQ